MNSAAQRLLAGWNDFWFQPEPPQALGACRILFYGGLFAISARADFTPLCSVAQFFWQPVSFYHTFFHHGPLSAPVTSWLQLIWKVSLVMSTVGFLTRLATVVSGALGLYLIGLCYNFSHLDHTMAVAGLILIMLPVSSCGRVWSIDQWIARRRGKILSPLSGDEARWPIQLARVMISLLMFGAGLNKLRASGLAWITTPTLQNLLLHFETPLGCWLAQRPMLCHFLAGFAVATEFFYPLALVSKKLARIWVPTQIALFIGIYLAMGINFYFLIYLNFFWLPWRRLFSTVPHRA